ncbi:MAG TPA: hypothetical protein VIU63_03335 [Nitrospira sp.]
MLHTLANIGEKPLEDEKKPVQVVAPWKVGKVAGVAQLVEQRFRKPKRKAR